MSDGERVIFYLTGQCLAAKPGSIIVIDEPEIHLHRSLQARLWDAVEAERPDCLFVYLTHDLDFASTRVDSTKIWLKSYSGTAWDWHVVPPEQEIPERLLLEILGSRKPILFTEGEKGSLDYLLYSHIYDDFTVVPCGSCEAVIHATKSFSSLKHLHSLSCRGIIDLDHRSPEQSEALRKIGVFTLETSEVENILVAEEVLKVVALTLHREDGEEIVNQAKQIVFSLIQRERESLISSMAKQKIDVNLKLFSTKSIGESAIAHDLAEFLKAIEVEGLYRDAASIVDSINPPVA